MEGQQQIPPNQAQPQRVQLSVAEFAAKYHSKREVYNFLAVDAGVYLPAYGKCFAHRLPPSRWPFGSGIDPNFSHFMPLEQVTIYFLKDLMAGSKKSIQGKNVAWIAIPQYEGLTIDKIAAFVAPYNVVADYLPHAKELGKLPKQWIANVCHTLLKTTFSDWVRK